MMPTNGNDKKRDECVQSLNDNTLDFESDDFVELNDNKGKLFETKYYIEYLMDIHSRKITSLKKGETLLVIYDFMNKQTDERVLVFLSQKKFLMYITKSFEEDFKLLQSESASVLKTANITESNDNI